MSRLRALIVDDEPLAHSILKGYIKESLLVKIVGHCYDGISTLDFLRREHVDVIFLDIHMPDLTGLELIEALKQDAPKVVLTTAFTDYAIEGFNHDQVVDYLHKPIRLARFLKALERVSRQIAMERSFQTQSIKSSQKIISKQQDEYLIIHENKVDYKIYLSDIVYIQSWGNYIKFFLEDQTMRITRKTIREQESTLPKDRFLRIHKSYIINMRYATSFEGQFIHLPDIKLPVGKSHIALVKRYFSR